MIRRIVELGFYDEEAGRHTQLQDIKVRVVPKDSYVRQ